MFVIVRFCISAKYITSLSAIENLLSSGKMFTDLLCPGAMKMFLFLYFTYLKSNLKFLSAFFFRQGVGELSDVLYFEDLVYALVYSLKSEIPRFQVIEGNKMAALKDFVQTLSDVSSCCYISLFNALMCLLDLVLLFLV